jgi:hypothetical protein
MHKNFLFNMLLRMELCRNPVHIDIQFVVMLY